METKTVDADERTIRRNLELWRKAKQKREQERQDRERQRQAHMDREFFVSHFNSLRDALKGGPNASR